MALTLLNAFAAEESGAVTVDWVVLTSALVGLGMAAVVLVSDGVENLSTNTSAELAAIDPESDPFGNNDFEPDQ